MNRPRVNWLRIIWKCQRRFDNMSKAYDFAHKQCIDLATNEILNWQKIRDTGQLGHKTPRKIRYKNDNLVPLDLNCDDPLYDGAPVF